MRDFSIHPALRSAPLAAVTMALVSSLLVDVGVHDMLLSVESDTVTAEGWDKLFTARLVIVILTAVQAYAAWKAWAILNPDRPDGFRAWAGVVAGVLVASVGLIIGCGIYGSTYQPEYSGNPVIWRVAAIWAGLWCMIGAAGARYAIHSHRVVRGRA